MSNLTNNRINVTATAAQITAVKAAFQTILTNLPFLIGLTIDERSSLPKMNVNNKAFVEDAINAGINNVALIPSYLSVPPMQNDNILFNQLDELEGIANQLCERIQDTRILAGSEAYVSALALYRLFGAAADAGVPGADAIVDHLKERFTQTATTTPTPVTPTPTL
ncbi:hypothetical protein [Flavobacterium restrictum]|uniref:Uncharacterized protein n=1 Tax=Flavobacterium restrictum TaxID=2594428 RepID=A0A553E735_9FLAO|nr:hypothetical protein [Flavobacterium restrictum]TRX40761.1 hypothetical protein FNW21_05520 [Flavobacterium restrictum]